jgi:hypothetical protein
MACLNQAYLPTNCSPNVSLYTVMPPPLTCPAYGGMPRIQSCSSTLVLDNFGVKYPLKHHADHLYNALSKNYEASTNWGSQPLLDLLMPNKEAIIVHTILAKIGHPQPATPMQVDNSTTNGILNGTIKQKRSCTMLMFFYWMRDRTKQGQFHVFWAPGSDKLANYFTKHHSLRYHCLMHPSYLHG